MKGLQFSSTADDRIPAGLRRSWNRRNVPEAVRQEWIDSFNRQWEVVGECGECEASLVRGEAVPHLMRHLPASVRPVLRQINELNADARAALPDALRRLYEAEADDAGADVR